MKWIMGFTLIALLCTAALINGYDSKVSRYSLAAHHQVPALSMAKKCSVSQLTVEQRLIDRFRGTFAWKVCVERKNAALRIIPDYAVIRELRFGTGYQLAIAFSSPASERVSRTIRDSIHNDVVVYRDGTVIDTFYPLDGEFRGEIYFWFREREEAEIAMDSVRGLLASQRAAETHQ